MAIYIEIIKVAETAGQAEYSFGASAEKVGRLRLNKASGAVTVLVPLADDVGSRYTARATQKIVQHWRKGESPARTCWAS